MNRCEKRLIELVKVQRSDQRSEVKRCGLQSQHGLEKAHQRGLALAERYPLKTTAAALDG